MKKLFIICLCLIICSCCVPVSKSWKASCGFKVTKAQFIEVSNELGYIVEKRNKNTSSTRDKFLRYHSDGSLTHEAILCPNLLESLFYGIGIDFKMNHFENEGTKLVEWFSKQGVHLEEETQNNDSH